MQGLSVSPERKSDQYLALTAPQLVFAVFFAMGLCRFFSVVPCMDRVRPCRVSVMCRLLVMSAFVMLGCFTVMPSGMSMMFRCLLVMFRSFL